MKIILNNIGSGELWLKIMKAICGDTKDKSMVDLGSHLAPYTPMLGFKENTYVDILERPLDYKDQQQFFVKSDMISFLEKCSHFDVAISSDSIEHLHKENGVTLVKLMELKSDKQIIFTPLGEYMVNEDVNNIDPDSHRSGWMPEDFEGWASVIMPNFHPRLNKGAFFAFNCNNIENEFYRISNELKQII